MDTRRTVSPESALASDIFDKFCSANTLKSILAHYRQLCSVLRIKPTHFPDFYPRLKSKLSSWRAQGLWAKFEKRASHKCYGRGKACAGNRVLIIGSGPCGLRAAIEAQLLGAKVVLIEKRDRFSRNNVLHLWPFVITDLKALGAKKFYGKFCAGSIDHISIRQLQCILLKVALLLGVEVHEGVSFEGLRSPADDNSQSGWRCHTSPPDHPVSHYTLDVLIGADGRRNTLDGFRRKALRAKLAIAITANFINKHTEAEARVKEISGVSYIFNQKFFQELNEATGIDLENIVYYKDETHYFVMTAKKQSLLQKGVLLHDYADTAKLLSHENISTENLMIYALEAAIFSTENQLPNLEFAVNHYGQPDVAMFDFTAMYQAENACRVVERNKQRLLMTLVGDSLLEPFWPTGSGCARGFLSSFDACWMLRSWAQGTRGPLEVMAERESIYRLLAQTTPENLNKEHTSYTIDPHSRYPNLNLRAVMPFQVKSLLDTDEPLQLDALDSGLSIGVAEGQQGVKKRRRDSVIAVDHLLTWLRDQCQCYNLEVNDVRDCFSSGEVLCAIIHRFRPDLIEEYPLPSEENVDPVECAGFRNQLAFDMLHEEYGLQHVMSGWESVQGAQAQDFLSCVAYLSQVYEIFRGEIPQVRWGAAGGRMESCEDLEEAVQRTAASSQHQFKYTFKTPAAVVGAVASKHHHGTGKTPSRRSRMSSSGRESRGGGDTGGDSEVSAGRRHKKRRSEDKSGRSGGGAVGALVAASSGASSGGSGGVVGGGNSGREIRTTLGGHRRSARGGSGGDDDSEKNVPGLARDLEAKLKGRSGCDSGGSSSSGQYSAQQKPKDLIRAIGKIEKTDWNVQLIEKKIAESKGPSLQKAERDDKVPKWSREAFDDKREALKRKMEGVTAPEGGTAALGQAEQLFEETMKKLGCKLRDGNALEVGQRGSNKVSAMAEQLVHKLEKGPPGSSGGSGAAATIAAAAAGGNHQHNQQTSSSSSSVPRPIFEFPKKGGSECCHFCKERVYVVERMTAEGKYFHRNCFRCEYCNTALRVGNYVFDREGRYGDRFFCTSHYNTIWLYGWKKYDQVDQVGGPQSAAADGTVGGAGTVQNPAGLGTAAPTAVGTLPAAASAVDVAAIKQRGGHLPGTPSSQQILSEMDERGTTPERVEFENSVECASEDDLLSEMDEDEWTDRNFGASNADNLTPDEASDLSDDDITPEGIHLKGGVDDIPERPHVVVVEPCSGGEGDADNAIISIEQPPASQVVVVKGDSSDSDTEVASGDDEDEDASLEDDDELEDDEEVDDEEDEEDDEDDEEEEEEEEGGGSTTEIETDSEFAEDPPHSVPGTIPTIVVDEPEQIVTRMIDMPISHTQTPTLKRNPKAGLDLHHQHHNHHHSNHNNQQQSNHHVKQQPPQVVYHIEDLNQRMVEPVKKTTVPERPLPRVTAVPKKWEPLSINPEGLASKMSLELKKKYMLHHGGGPLVGGGGIGSHQMQQQQKPGQGGAAQNQQFRSVLDMISEQQKLLQPAPKPSATMQAFLDGAEKLKQKPNISPLSCSTGNKAVGEIPQPSSQQKNQIATPQQQQQLDPAGPSSGDDGDVTPTPPSPGVLEGGGSVTSNPWLNSDVVVVVNGGGVGGGELDNTLSMNRINLEKSAAAAAAAAAETAQVKISPVGEKQDVGREKQEVVVVVNGGGNHDDNEEGNDHNHHHHHNHAPVVMVLSSEGLSQSETETQSTIIAVNKVGGGGGILLEDDQKTPVAEKPFEHNLEPGKDRVAMPLGGLQGESAEEEEDSDTETGDDPLSDELEDEEYGEEDGARVTREPPRVEIEDEFGGVTLAVDVDQEIDESIRISSSDSRDSLNSGVFLETELSDWVKEGGEEMGGAAEEAGGAAVKDNNVRGARKHHHHQKGKRVHSGGNKGMGASAANKPPLCLDLEDMDFMDVDGLSSPEEVKIVKRVGGVGYSKLGGDDEEDEEEAEDQGPESILPDFSVVLRTTQPHDTQPSPNTLERQQRPTYSSDEREDESGRSSTPTVEESLGKGGKGGGKEVSSSKKKIAELTRLPELHEAVNPVIVKEVAAIQAAAVGGEGKELPRKGPFSNARDSLDYRKMKTPTTTASGGGPVVKSKDLYSTWMKGGMVGGDFLAEENSSGSSASSATTSSGGGNNIASPEMARKIEEIHKERAKQNDLIRSMVMGRIRKSPEKNSRRGSRGSLSPLGGGSSSGSGSSEHVLRACGGGVGAGGQDETADSRRSSQNSILSRETEEEEEEGEMDVPSTNTTTTTTTSSGSIPHQKLVKSSSQTTQSTGSTTSQSPPQQQQQYQAQYSPVFSSSPRFRHRPKFESPLSVYQSVTNPPTPVNPATASQLVTPNSEGGASSNPSAAAELPPSSGGGKSMKMFKSHSPSFYRSMPDLSAFLVSPLPGHHGNNGGGGDPLSSSNNFATPDVSKWENYKHHRNGGAAPTSVDREKARQAARERARLKSDEELGLSPTDYANLKEKVRRKASVPTSDDDVFVSVSTKTGGGSVPTTPVRETLRGGAAMFHPGGRRLARPMSDVFDAAFSLRPNVDFPIQKTNPFLVGGGNGGAAAVAATQHHPQYPYPSNFHGGHHQSTDANGAAGVPSVGRGEVATEWYNYHDDQTPPPPAPSDPPQGGLMSSSCPQNYGDELEDDGFLHLKLRLSSGSKPSERKISPEKAKSMGWSSGASEVEQYPLGSPPSNYLMSSSANSPAGIMLTSTPTLGHHPARGTPSSLTARADGNWFFDSKLQQQGSARPRSNTLSELNLSPSSLHSTGNNGSSTANNNNNNNNNGTFPTTPTTSPSAPPQNTAAAENAQVSQAVTGAAAPTPSTPKLKALSTDTLLDSTAEHSTPLENSKGASVPDISQHAAQDTISHHPNKNSTVVPSTTSPNSSNNNNNNSANNAAVRVSPPERKNRKSKDRDRRRSLIQAVSDFFTIRGSSSSSASGGAGGGTGTPSSQTASQNVSPSDKSSSQHTSNSATSSGSNGGIHHAAGGAYHAVGGGSSGEGGDPSNNGGANGKERFSIFKLTPTKILQSAKDRRNSKSREILVSPPPPAPSSPPRRESTGLGASQHFQQQQQPPPPQQQQYSHHHLHQHPSQHHHQQQQQHLRHHQMVDPNNPPPKPARAAQYLSQPEMVIQRLTQSPTTYKSHRTSRGGGSCGGAGGPDAFDHSGSTPTLAGLGASAVSDHMATLSIVATPVKPARSTMAVMSSGGGGGGGGYYRNRMREMQEIQLQLESVDQQQRSLEARGVAVEKRIRGEVEPHDQIVEQREEQELMEEWFTLVREKTRLARWEKELLVRAEELELEARKERLEEQLDNSLLLKDDIKSPEDKNREIELLHQLRAVEEQRGKLLSSFQEDMRQYENEDADLEAKIQSSRLSPKESNV